MEPVARGGRATAENPRLRCRAHNQYAAEQQFGSGFMSRKREAAQQAAREARAQAGGENAALVTERACGFAVAPARERVRAAVVPAPAGEETRARAAEQRAREVAAAEEVVPWLRALGLRVDEARRAAARCEGMAEAPLEARVRHALACSARAGRREAAPTP